MNGKGYTLLEIAVTLAIASVIAALSVYHFSAPSPHRVLQAAGQTLIQKLRLARQKAIADGQESVVTFKPSQDQYEHPVLGTTTLPRSVQFGCPNCEPARQDGSSFDDNKNQATFNPDGTADDWGSLYLFSPLSGDTFKITVNATGRIAQEPYNNELE